MQSDAVEAGTDADMVALGGGPVCIWEHQLILAFVACYCVGRRELLYGDSKQKESKARDRV